jgi:hypothetical protein
MAVFRSPLILDSSGGAPSEAVEVYRTQRKTWHLEYLTKPSMAPTQILQVAGP